MIYITTILIHVQIVFAHRKNLTCSNIYRIKTYNKIFTFNKILFDDSVIMFQI